MCSRERETLSLEHSGNQDDGQKKECRLRLRLPVVRHQKNDDQRTAHYGTEYATQPKFTLEIDN